MSGWIVPVKNGTNYPIKGNTFYITTKSATGGSDEVNFILKPDTDNGYVTNIVWRFIDWGYYVIYCTLTDYSQKFPVTPPTGVSKIWEITVSPDDITIKCNTLQVLHFIFNNTYINDDTCTTNVKGKTATQVVFWGSDTATKLLESEKVGK